MVGLKLCQVKKTVVLCFLIGSIVIVLSILVEKWEKVAEAIMIFGFIISMSGLLPILLFWKCPNCGKSLPIHGMWSITYCPYCRSKLND